VGAVSTLVITPPALLLLMVFGYEHVVAFARKKSILYLPGASSFSQIAMENDGTDISIFTKNILFCQFCDHKYILAKKHSTAV